MPTYYYRSLDESGLEVKGDLEAPDFHQAIRILRERKLVPFEVKEQETNHARTAGLFRNRRIRERELQAFSRQMSLLLRSGVTLDRALGIISDSNNNLSLARTVQDIKRQIKEGKPLSEALESQSRIFKPFFISMIKMGEETGNLSGAFDSVSDYLTFSQRILSEIKNALIYPLFLVIVSIITVGAIFSFVLPRFFSLLPEGQTATLPLVSRALFHLADFFHHYLYLVIALSLILLLMVRGLWGLDLGKRAISGLLLRVPLLRDLILYFELSRFSYTLAAMLRGGVEIIEALELAIATLQNPSIKADLSPIVREIRGGNRLSEALARIRYLPNSFLGVITVGEEGGNLAEVMGEIAQSYDEEFKLIIKRLLVLLEPMIISIMGIIVGIIVVSLFLTITSINTLGL